jgi:hypothetical protein
MEVFSHLLPASCKVLKSLVILCLGVPAFDDGASEDCPVRLGFSISAHGELDAKIEEKYAGQSHLL